MIYIDVLGSKWYPARRLKRVSNRVRNAFEIYCARLLILKVKEAVRVQKYASKWIALNPNYLRKKLESGQELGMWIADDMLIRQLKLKDNRHIGWDNRLRRDGVPYLLIAKSLEWGTIRIPPRPLFRKVKSQIQRNLDIIYKNFRGGKDVTEII